MTKECEKITAGAACGGLGGICTETAFVCIGRGEKAAEGGTDGSGATWGRFRVVSAYARDSRGKIASCRGFAVCSAACLGRSGSTGSR